MLKKTLIITLLLVGTLFAAGVYGVRIWHLSYLQIVPQRFRMRAARPVYPYSIVPGGTYDASEIADSVRRDAVVRQHYEGIHIESLHTVRMQKPMLAYVSYRKGDSVRWTDHPVQIVANELMLTDGTNMVRARCGNRVQFVKPQPLPATVQNPDPPPPDIAFDSPLPAPTTPVIFAPPVILPPPPPPLFSQVKIPIVPPENWTPPIVPCCESNPPVSPVPEPQTLALFSVGAFALARKFWKT